jgi:hypothetical protein
LQTSWCLSTDAKFGNRFLVIGLRKNYHALETNFNDLCFLFNFLLFWSLKYVENYVKSCQGITSPTSNFPDGQDNTAHITKWLKERGARGLQGGRAAEQSVLPHDFQMYYGRCFTTTQTHSNKAKEATVIGPILCNPTQYIVSH